jgi:hypothetical protein
MSLGAIETRQQRKGIVVVEAFHVAFQFLELVAESMVAHGFLEIGQQFVRHEVVAFEQTAQLPRQFFGALQMELAAFFVAGNRRCVAVSEKTSAFRPERAGNPRRPA